MKHSHFPGDPAEWAALYAAGALTPREREQFEAHLAAGCEACQAELRQLENVITSLAGAVERATPDPRVREALLKRIATSQEGLSPLRRHLHDAPPAQGPELFLQKAQEAAWKEADVPGVRIRTLFVDREHNQFTALVRMAAGASYPCHVHSGPEECLVLEGDLRVGDLVLWPGDYQRAPAGSRHGEQSTEKGCLLLITSSLTDVFE